MRRRFGLLVLPLSILILALVGGPPADAAGGGSAVACTQSATTTTTTPAGVEGPPTSPPAGPSPASPCWVDVDPYPFGSEGIPVETPAQPVLACLQRRSPTGEPVRPHRDVDGFQGLEPRARGDRHERRTGGRCEQSLRSLALQRRLLVPESRLSGLQRLPGPHGRVGRQARLLADRGPVRPGLEPPLPLRRRQLSNGSRSRSRRRRSHAHRGPVAEASRRPGGITSAACFSLGRLLVLRDLRHRPALGRDRSRMPRRTRR